MSRRQISFFIDTALYKEFGKKCIDLDKSKTEVLVELIRRFVKN